MVQSDALMLWAQNEAQISDLCLDMNGPMHTLCVQVFDGTSHFPRSFFRDLSFAFVRDLSSAFVYSTVLKNNKVVYIS